MTEPEMETMPIKSKFEVETPGKVNALSFRTKKTMTLILAGLETGEIRLWEYRSKSELIHGFDKLKGAVRGVDLHKSKDIFVSGGDDREINVWEWSKSSSPTVTLSGHSGTIRSVQFHGEYPWIVSASDDHSVRIWNWQSRSIVHVFNQHTDRVNSACFHAKYDMLVSASMDKTVWVVDFTSLTVSLDTLPRVNEDGTCRVLTLPGGVNWASFHPTLPVLVSCADHMIYVSEYEKESKMWEWWELEGHVDKVSSVMFHPKKELIVSNSHDMWTKLWSWSESEYSLLHQFRSCGSDRFFCLAIHPEVNLIAAGHDHGVIVFKPLRDRPPYAVCGDSFLYVKNLVYLHHDFLTQIDSPIVPITSCRARTSFYHPEGRLVVGTSSDSIAADLMVTDWSLSATSFVSLDGNQLAYLRKFSHLSQLFWSMTDYVVIRDLEDNRCGNFELPIATDAIFYGGEGLLVCRSSQHSSQQRVILFDIAQERGVMAELQTQERVRYVVWSNDMESVALLSKHTILIASKKLVIQGTCHETKAVKSGAWEDNGVFIYSTPHHIKYCLPNGESGIIKSLDVPIYITKVSGNMIYYLDRNVNTGTISFDADEYLLKVSLLRKEYDKVSCIIKNSSAIHKEAMAFYLRHKGFPEFAVHLVEDERVRFKLALETCNFREAVASAAKIDKKEQWHELGVKALSHGIVGTAELSFQKAKDFQKLSHLYIITGNRDKLSKLMKIAEGENNVMGQFQSALFLGDVEERVKILEKAGQVHLAYTTASVHGLKDIAERLSTTYLGDDVPSWPEGKTPSLLMPPLPVICGRDWPLIKPVAKEVEDAEPAIGEQPVERMLRRRVRDGPRMVEKVERMLRRRVRTGPRMVEKVGDDDYSWEKEVSKETREG